VIRWAFIGEMSLIDAVIQLVTDLEPWPVSAACNVSDFVAAGGRGDTMKIPIARPMTFDDWNRPHRVPGTDTYICWNEEGKKLPPMEPGDNIHKVYLQPDSCIPPGQVVAFWPELGQQAIVKMSRDELAALYPPPKG
jgi:hypothetical protein